MKLDFDEALEKAGGFGYVQLIHFSLLFVVQVFQGPYVVSLAFIGKEPTFQCKGRAGEDPCQLHPPCREFVYSKNFTSVVSEWDLVCDRKRDASYAQSLLMLGFLAGVVVMGRIADKIGRLKTYAVGMVAVAVAQLVSGFAQNIYQYAFTRFLVGFFGGGGALAGHVLMLEGMVPRLWALITTIYSCGNSLGISMFGVMAYYVRDWRNLTFVTCIPIVLYMVIPLVLPESARWLASQGRLEEAEDILVHTAKKNGLQITRATISLTDKTVDAKTKHSKGIFLDLFRTPVLRWRMIVLMVTWFTCCMTYYGLIFASSDLGGNMYVTFALSGFVEVPASLLSLYTFNRLGRRPTMAGSLFVAGITCLAVMALPKSGAGEMPFIRTCMALVSKMGISITFISAYLYSTELLPTVVRNTAMGVCSMTARVGGIIAPTLPPFGERFAYLVFGVTALLSALLDLTLPESLNKPLPETIADVENEGAIVVPHEEKQPSVS